MKNIMKKCEADYKFLQRVDISNVLCSDREETVYKRLFKVYADRKDSFSKEVMPRLLTFHRDLQR